MISYDPLFKTLEEKDLSIWELPELLGFSTATIPRFNRNESVTLETIDRIACFLQVPVERIVQIVYDDESYVFEHKTKVTIKNLKLLRKQRGLTQIELAAMLGMAQPHISRWEKGESVISTDNYNNLVEKLQMNEEEIKLITD